MTITPTAAGCAEVIGMDCPGRLPARSKRAVGGGWEAPTLPSYAMTSAPGRETFPDGQEIRL